MEACSVTITGTLAYEPQLKHNANGDPRLILTLKVQTRASRTRWIKVKAFGLLAVRSAESYHEGDRITVRGDDLEAWGRVDDRPAGGRYQDTQDDGPRIQCWAFLTAYDIALSTASDTAASGQSARRETGPGEAHDGEAGPDPVTFEERANLSVIDGVNA